MQTYQIPLLPKSAFATKLSGDTLFGQFCWAISLRYGQQRLSDLLDGYTDNSPFIVFSDALPDGYLPRPQLPTYFLAGGNSDVAKRKAQKKLLWVKESALSEPLSHWLSNGMIVSSNSLIEKYDENSKKVVAAAWQVDELQPHNSINRMLNTTDGDEFAPFSEQRSWYHSDAKLSLTVVLDESQLSLAEMMLCLQDIGTTGYGKNASTGCGRFVLGEAVNAPVRQQSDSNAYLCLAPCAPQNQGFVADNSFYSTMVKFGRHGNLAVHGGNPFKSPILMADTGAVLSPQNYSEVLFTGQGLGGNGEVSANVPATVHQGYAPVIGIRLEKAELAQVNC